VVAMSGVELVRCEGVDGTWHWVFGSIRCEDLFASNWHHNMIAYTLELLLINIHSSPETIRESCKSMVGAWTALAAQYILLRQCSKGSSHGTTPGNASRLQVLMANIHEIAYCDPSGIRTVSRTSRNS